MIRILAIDDEDVYETSCGAAWVFTEGGPGENGVRYCHKCGGLVEVIYPAFERDEEEDG